MNSSLLLSISLFFVSYFGFTQDKYIDIPRTRVSMIKPSGYELMKYQTGFKKDEFQSISITDLVIGNYYSNTKDFNRNTFENQGVNVKEFKSISISGFPGKFLLADINYSEMDVFMLVFGDSTFSTMVTSVFDPSDTNNENEIRKCLLSIKYNKHKTVDPLENIMFSADTISTDLKLSVFSGNIYTFSINGKDNISEDTIMVSVLPVEFDKDNTLRELSTMYMEKLSEKGFWGIMTDNTIQSKVKDYDRFSAYGSCYIEFDKLYFYQIILLKDDLCLLGQGYCRYDNENAKKEISKFCESIKLKN